MIRILRDFVSSGEGREYKFKLGRTIASSLAGFICGVIISSIVWFVAVKYLDSAVLQVIATTR